MTLKSDASFRISGPCLSMFLHDCECSISDQMGFLIGDKYNVTTQAINDEQSGAESVGTSVNINGIFPIGLPFLFCSPLGRIDENSLKEILKSSEKDVVGWYSFRRNSNNGASLRETLLHRELCKALNHMPHHLFLFCILTGSTDDVNATHSFAFTFYVLSHRRFEPVSVSESNVGEPEDNMYKRRSEINSSFTHLHAVQQSINGIQSPKTAMVTLQREVTRHIDALENSINRLQAEVNQCFKMKFPSFNCTAVSQKCSRSMPNSSRMKHGELSAEY